MNNRISISAFARWHHGYVSLLLARGDTAAPSGLYTRLCHKFLVILCFSCFSLKCYMFVIPK